MWPMRNFVGARGKMGASALMDYGIGLPRQACVSIAVNARVRRRMATRCQTASVRPAIKAS
jgi:hypothetical protein